MGKHRGVGSRGVVLLFLVLFGLIFSAIAALFASAQVTKVPGVTSAVAVSGATLID